MKEMRREDELPKEEAELVIVMREEAAAEVAAAKPKGRRKR